MTKCVIYTRAKYERHHEVQQEVCERYASEHGYAVARVTRDLDAAITLLDPDTVLVVYDVNRISRYTSTVNDSLQRIDERGSRIAFVNDPGGLNKLHLRTLLERAIMEP